MPRTSKNDQSTIGDSWVVEESSPPTEEAVDSKPTAGSTSTQQNGIRTGRYATRSRTSRSTTPAVNSGPDLVMPSLQASTSTTTDGSWVVPNSKTQMEDSATARTRSRKSSNESTSPGDPDIVKPEDTQENASDPQATATSSANGPGSAESVRKIFGIPINSTALTRVFHVIFFSCMLRFIWVPTLIAYYPDICQYSVIWSTYPDACLAVETAGIDTSYTPPVEYQYLIDSHTRLESVVNATSKEISQAPDLIKQTETELDHAYKIFESSPIDAVFELELEYESAVNAIRTAKQRFENLNLHIETTAGARQSEARRFQRILGYAAHIDETSTGFKSLARKYLKALLSFDMERSDTAVLDGQIARHDSTLDRITSILIADSEAALNDLSTIDEHFHAIKEIARRENERLGNPDCDPDSDSAGDSPFATLLKVFRVPVDSKIGSYINPKKGACETSSEDESVTSALKTLRDTSKPAKSLTGIFEKLLEELWAVRAEWETGSKLMQEKKQLKPTN